MAGLYLHIPFCKQACHYCNFHFSTSLKYKNEMVAAMLHEIDLQHTYLKDSKLQSIYFGGGTPSILDADDLKLIFDKIRTHFSISPQAEITLEANPDDINTKKLNSWALLGINRLSIGVQSFANEDLTYMNRAHNAQEAKACIQLAQDAGFHNLTVDLIYGAPSTSDEVWEQNVQTLFDLQIPHLSCYALTVEPKTALAYKVKKAILPPVEDEQAARQYELLMEWMAANDYIHYETSNFAKEGFFAKHNSAYWTGAHYLGIGPSAHSYNGHSRQWNVANNAKYMNALQSSDKTTPFFEVETLSLEDQYNELILTGLRTIWGVQLDKLPTQLQQQFQEDIQQFIDTQHIQKTNKNYILTNKGRLISDYISSQLFL